MTPYTYDVHASNSNDWKAFYVDVNGNDLGNGSLEEPFATIQRARDEVRKYNDYMQSNISVYIGDGSYSISDTIKFDERDSTTNGYKISYRAIEGTTPIISGGKEIKGWTEYQNGIYKTNVGDLRFRQFYVNDSKAIRARTPNIGEDYYRNIWVKYINDRKLQVKKSDIDISKLQDVGQVEAVIFSHWAESYVRFNVNKDNPIVDRGDYLQVEIQEDEKNIIINRGYPLQREQDPYYLENALGFLDVENEWYLNNETGDLYYKPEQGKTMADLEVIVPVVETLWEVKGTLDKPIENIEVYGLTFKYSTWLRPNEYGQLDTQAGQFNTYAESNNKQWIGRPKAGVYFACTSNLNFERNKLENLGATALDLHYGTRNSKVTGNLISDICGNGITHAVFNNEDSEIHQPYNPQDKREINYDDIISNNYITRIGTDYQGTIAIAAGYPQGLVIEHNQITDIPYTAISVGWGWTSRSNAMEHNVIRNNEIYNVLRLLSDGAAIYSLSNQPNSQIVQNYIHNISLDPTTQPAPVCGIFMDEGSSGFTVNENVITDMGTGTRRIFRNANSNPYTDTTDLLVDVIDSAGIMPEYLDILDNVPKPMINTITNTVEQGEILNIEGIGFGLEKGSIMLRSVDSIQSVAKDAIFSWSDTSITFKMPKASLVGSTNLYVVTASGHKSRSSEITVTKRSEIKKLIENFDSYAEGILPTDSIWDKGVGAAIVSDIDGKALQLTSKGSNASATLSGINSNFNLSFDMKFDTTLQNSEGLYLKFRDNSGQQFYRLEYLPGWHQKYTIKQGESNVIDTVNLATDYNVWYRVKLSCDGDKIRSKVWNKDDPEPENWTLDITDLSLKSGEISFEFYSTNGTMTFDEIKIEKIEDIIEDPELGSERKINFEDYAVGELPVNNIWIKSTTSQIVSVKDNKYLKLTSKGNNAIATLQGIYQNYDLKYDIRFDSEFNESGSPGLYVHFKDADGTNFYRLEYLPTWDNKFTIKRGNITILGKDNNVITEYGSWYTIRISCEGSLICAKVWKRGEEEPVEWNIECENDDIEKGNISFQYYSENNSLSIDNIELSNVNFESARE